MFDFSYLKIPFLVKSKYGSSRDDVFTSNFSSIYIEKYYGYGGNDIFISSAGADHYYGGSGVDSVDYSNSTRNVTIDLARGYGANGAYGDKFFSIENARGSNYDDYIFGSAASNIIVGEGGNDSLAGNGGDDSVYGQTGNDLVLGGTGNDDLFGGSGDDDFRIEIGQDDYYGGSGTDTISVLDQSNITINLATGRGSGGQAQGDTYHSIEGVSIVDNASNIEVIGSSQDEFFMAEMDATTNLRINGNAGNDHFEFQYLDSEGDFENHDNSLFDGGAGVDTIAVVTYLDIVFDLENNELYENDNEADQIQISNFENAIGDHGNDTFIDDDGANNEYTGGSGEDVFIFDHDERNDRDVITDFEIGIDHIDLDNSNISNYNDLTNGGSNGMRQNGDDVVIYDNRGNTITLLDIDMSDLSSGDFIF